jgi:HAE1 family hydrophobic/amphiphilic exporter-1
MLKKFIERPVLSTVVSIILLILGGLSIFTLPISLFPDIAPPSVLVTATYPGANAEVVARSVATPLEEAINLDTETAEQHHYVHRALFYRQQL